MPSCYLFVQSWKAAFYKSSLSDALLSTLRSKGARREVEGEEEGSDAPRVTEADLLRLSSAQAPAPHFLVPRQ